MSIELLTNGRISPLGIDLAPVFSWRGDIDFTQTAYRITVTAEGTAVWDSGWVESGDSQWIRGDFAPASRTVYAWSVTLKDGQGNEHSLGSARFETGLLSPSDWTSEWIGGGRQYLPNRALYFRRTFDVRGQVARARLYFSGMGIGVPHLNGVRVGDHKLDPAQTEYPQKVFYSVYDVTDALTEGANCLAAEVGDGWYSQNQLMDGGGVYGLPCLRAQLEITYADGRRDVINSDTAFSVSRSATVYNNIYIGETYDAREEKPRWDCADFEEDFLWTPAVPDTVEKGPMVWQFLPPMKVCREIHPVAVTKPQDGVFVVDFGENMTGTVRLRIKGKPGNVIRLRFAECLDDHGMIDVDSTGVFHICGVQTLTYVFGTRAEGGTQMCDESGHFYYTGGSEAVWEPEFCYFGFRYAEVTGAHDRITADTLTGLKIYSSFADASSFTCDRPILNDMEQLLRRTLPNNAQGLPTDCPHREKCGWTGDANIISDAALILWNCRDFFEKYSADIVEAHRQNGVYANVTPGKRQCLDTVPAWGTALINIPWRIWRAGGDIGVLERFYDEMAAYGRYILAESKDGVYKNHGYKLADWAAPYGYKSETHFFEITGIYMFLAFRTLADAAAILGRETEAAVWRERAAFEKSVVQKLYYKPDEHTYGSQTLNAFADELGLIPAGEEEAAAAWTERDVIGHEYHITCGHIGVRYIFRYLNKYGHVDTLNRVLDTRTYPSFGAQLDAGATTLYECFTLNTHDQSLDHPFKGSYCVWLYEDVLGIRLLEPGYRRFAFAPVPGVAREAKGHIDTPYGRIEAAWKSGEGMTVTVPWNTTAEVTLPDGTVRIVGPGHYEFNA